MSDFNSLTASELGHMIGQGKIDPVELTEYFISQIELSPIGEKVYSTCLLYTSPSPRDAHESRMPSSA